LKIGIGLPSAVPGTEASLLIEWATRAEAQAFSSLGVVDRPRYDSFDPMTTLAMAAAVTSDIGLVTMVVIGPLRGTALLAKEAATIDAISGGRLALGLAVGARVDDYLAAGVAPAGRGDRLTDQLAELRSFWERDETRSLLQSPHGPPLLVGGMNDAAFYRMARYADGYIHGGGPPKTFERAAGRARTAWADLERVGSPSLWAQGYFALGNDEVVARGRSYMRDYYAFTGPFADKIAEGMLATPQAVAQFVRGYAEAGCEELVLLPAVADLEQIDRLRNSLAGVV
jgi:alkanesulfonate monooxygenase SsuD/methylene tetrahydromethanopterin reductase-like flavin-dependent oxidoreductase (luciferase family)